MRELEKHGRITRQSHIYRLEPHLDEKGLLRVGGRLGKADLPTSSKHPALLPWNHFVTELIVREVHENEAGHSGREHTLAVLRQEFWVPNG